MLTGWKFMLGFSSVNIVVHFHTRPLQMTFLHLFRFSLFFLSSVVQFLKYQSCISFDIYIYKHFIFLMLSQFLNFSFKLLLVYRNTTDLWLLILKSKILLNWLMGSGSFFADSTRFSLQSCSLCHYNLWYLLFLPIGPYFHLV